MVLARWRRPGWRGGARSRAATEDRGPGLPRGAGPGGLVVVNVLAQPVAEASLEVGELLERGPIEAVVVVKVDEAVSPGVPWQALDLAQEAEGRPAWVRDVQHPPRDLPLGDGGDVLPQGLRRKPRIAGGFAQGELDRPLRLLQREPLRVRGRVWSG